jgi:hypothetical protein
MDHDPAAQGDPNAITLHVELPQQFTLEDAGLAFHQIAQCLNRMVGIGMATGAVTAGGGITQQAFGAAAALEQAAGLIQQAIEARRAQSGIVQAMPMPPRGPIRMN